VASNDRDPKTLSDKVLAIFQADESGARSTTGRVWRDIDLGSEDGWPSSTVLNVRTLS